MRSVPSATDRIVRYGPFHHLFSIIGMSESELKSALSQREFANAILRDIYAFSSFLVSKSVSDRIRPVAPYVNNVANLYVLFVRNPLSVERHADKFALIPKFAHVCRTLTLGYPARTYHDIIETTERLNRSGGVEPYDWLKSLPD